jgi:serine/threonine protein kinase
MNIDREQWLRLSSLLDAALDLDAGQREAWLAQLPSDVAALREPLRTLLARQAHIETDEFLKAPDFAAALLTESARAQLPPQELHAQATLGAYRLLRELGRGGMGSVWQAERIDGKLKRQVALKIPYAGPYQRELAARLARERDILAGLEHPNIARLYDADVSPQGQPFLVLEYVDGVPINEYCDRQHLSPRERLVLFLQVLAAVQYAHTHLVIHRDLKPSNILITTGGIARLLDFGIAKLIPESELRQTALTQFGSRVLTPDYASPEQIAGQLVTTASDVYSLGIVLFELLTGARPYRLKRDSRASLEEAIAEADVIAPSRAEAAAHLQPYQRQLRGDLDTIVLKALRKDPLERYASVDAFRRDLERSLDNQPVDARPHSRRYLFGRLLARNKLAFGAASVVLVSLLVGIGAASWQAARARASEQRALAEARTAQAVKQFMIRIFQTNSARQEDPAKARTKSALELLEAGADRVGVEFKDDPALQRELLTVILELLGESKSKSDTFEKHALHLLTLLKGVPGSEAQQAEIYDNLSIIRQGGDPAQAIAYAKSGLAVVATPKDPQQRKLRAGLLTDLAAMEMNTDVEAATAALLEARALLAREFAHTAEYGDLLVLLGTLEKRRDHADAAVGYFEEAMKAISSDPTAFDKSIARGHHYLAMGYLARKQYAAAERELRLASKLFEKAYGPLDPQVAFTNARLASVITPQNRYDDALELLDPAVKVLDTRTPNFNADYFAGGLGYFADVLVASGRMQAAEPAVQRMLKESVRLAPLFRVDHLFIAADYELMRGDDKAAEQHAHQAVAFAAQAYGANGSMTLRYNVSLGRLLVSLGKLAEADALFTAVMNADSVNAAVFNSAWTSASVQHARVRSARGESAAAATSLAATLAKYQQQLPEQRDLNDEFELQSELGRALIAADRPADALPHLERALELRATQYFSSPRLAEAQVLLADCELRTGNVDGSRALLGKARAIYAANQGISARYTTAFRDVSGRLARATRTGS